jgi:hypothetical protein
MANPRTETSPTAESTKEGPADGLPPRPKKARPVVWETRYAALVAYKAKYGHSQVPHKWPENMSLGRWVSLQRTTQFTGRMKPEREARLEALGFQWQRKGHAEVWEEHLQHLCDYQQKHGHLGVMKAEDRKLWNWISLQRYLYSEGTLKPNRQERLEAIGFQWKGYEALNMNLVPGLEKRWNTMCGLLENHIAQEGPGCIGELSHQPDVLGQWLWNQRRKARRGLLPPECRARLEAAGVLADLDYLYPSPNWQARCADLQAFFQKHGHTCAEAPMKDYLRGWCRELRMARKLGELKPEHITLLDALNFEWENPDPRHNSFLRAQRVWNRQYEKLRSFYEEHGHSDLPHYYQGETKLYRWADKQRTQHKRGLLSPEQEARLAELNFRTGRQRPENYDAWEAHYAELTAYHEKHGHSRVRSQDEALLSYWRYQQWHAREAGTLSAEKIARLDALGFVWAPASSTQTETGQPLSSVEERRWNRYYRKLQAYYQEHGHCQVPLDAPGHEKLVEWVIHQRYKLMEGQLSAARVELLAELGFK